MRTKFATRDGVPMLLVFWCPGCAETHAIPVVGEHAWVWNNDRDKPTLSPSILRRDKRPITDDEHARIMAGEQPAIPDRVCHSFINDGRIQFLGDCTHALAGQTVDLPELPA